MKTDSSRLIEKNSFFDKVSICPWWLPPLFFIPAIIYFLFQGFQEITIENWYYGIICASTGFLLWSLTEYLLHRFVFHYKPTSYFGKKLIYLLHGAHHDSPNDLKRLVFPITVSIPLAFMMYYLFNMINWVNGGYHSIFFSTFLFGYLCYDMIHYASHAITANNKLFTVIKKNHMVHHFQEPETNFGVSSKLWDNIFGTLKRK